MSEIKRVNLYKLSDTETVVVELADQAYFSEAMPYGYAANGAKCLVVDGRYYPILDGTPDEGYAKWEFASYEAKELEKDAEIASLPAILREKYFANHVPWVERKAAKEAGDLERAEREARRAEAAEAVPNRRVPRG